MCNGRGRLGNKTTSGSGNNGSSLIAAIEEEGIMLLGEIVPNFLFYFNEFFQKRWHSYLAFDEK